jgi:anti-sigma regulatory factor (Ser/Thr protein kinase)
MLASDARYLPVVRSTVSALTAAIGWDESDCRAITLALDEAVANVIRHGYHNRPDGVIELRCRGNTDGLEVTMLDHGDAPDSARICAREVGSDQVGGLGTHIIRDVMDSVAYHLGGSGNLFVASKRLRRKT